MPSLISKIETILFVAGKPLAAKKISKALNENEEKISECLTALLEKYNASEDAGVVIMRNNGEWQMVSNPENREAAENFLKAEISGELTRPQLETLTVISYCGPITKPELEQVRGVNCGLILRNLMIRGLIKENNDASGLLPTYEASMDYLRHLGISDLRELPDYAELHKHEYIEIAKEEKQI
ncbi:MAG: SMC-Scp complex subunit ScpB [Patescibacteria group bacterium]|nr:SMC-Scp complex subunit ScpB [Patescibacteria group bacterium]